jgi:hypothetical protein
MASVVVSVMFETASSGMALVLLATVLAVMASVK